MLNKCFQCDDRKINNEIFLHKLYSLCFSVPWNYCYVDCLFFAMIFYFHFFFLIFFFKEYFSLIILDWLILMLCQPVLVSLVWFHGITTTEGYLMPSPLYTYILNESKYGSKYQILSYTTFNMDDFKTIYIYENLLVVAYFLINGRIYLVSLGNPTFSNMFPRARHVLKTFELWTLCARLWIFSLYISHLLLSSQQVSIAMWTIMISESWWWLLKPKR